MPALCDVNVLLALVTDRHAHHAAALGWFDGVTAGEAIVCRAAQMGLLRLLNNPAVMHEEVLDTATCWKTWHTLVRDDRIHFSTEEPPQLDSAFERVTTGRTFSPRLWTDAYLAAYALAGGLTMVTFDKGFRQYPDVALHLLHSASRAE